MTELDGPAFAAAMEAAVEGIKMRGKATEGEKTMLDALCPALRAVKAAVESGKSLKEALQDGAAAAEQGVAYTKTIIATKAGPATSASAAWAIRTGSDVVVVMLRTMAEHIDE